MQVPRAPMKPRCVHWYWACRSQFRHALKDKQLTSSTSMSSLGLLSTWIASTVALCSSSSVNSLRSLSSSSPAGSFRLFPLRPFGAFEPEATALLPSPFNHSAGTCCHSSSVSRRRRLVLVPRGSETGVFAVSFPLPGALEGVPPGVGPGACSTG